jgi:hypothetical protein
MRVSVCLSSARASSAMCAATLLLAFAITPPRPVQAQAGAEAAAAAKQAADWAEKRQGGQDATASPKTIAQPRGRAAAPATAPALPPRQPSGKSARLAGTVAERTAGAAVADVVVSLTSAEPEFAVETLLARTDSAGRYAFPAVEPGRWSLGVVQDRLPAAYAAGPARLVSVAPRDSLTLPPLLLDRTACVRGRVVWADGYVFSEGAVQVAPADTAKAVAQGRLDGVGDYEICSAPAGSAMVWLLLHDGRRLGLPTQLDTAHPASLDFRPEPLADLRGSVLHVEARTADGQTVGKAQVVAVGRKLPVGGEPMTVYAREAVADAGGVTDLHLPYGTYEILVMNPREGQYGRVEQFVIAPGVPPEVTHVVTVRDSSTAEQRQGWRRVLLERADRFQRWWAL